MLLPVARFPNEAKSAIRRSRVVLKGIPIKSKMPIVDFTTLRSWLTSSILVYSGGQPTANQSDGTKRRCANASQSGLLAT
jgi:hypothetical protein